MWATSGVDYSAEPALLALPEPLFLDGLELALEHVGQYAGNNPYVDEINQLLGRRGIYFRFDPWAGKAAWVGDAGSHALTVQPALTALGDARLQGARTEFEAALGHLRRGTAKDHEDAIEEAGKAVESAMKVLLDNRGLTRSGRETAFPLFNLLRDNSIVEPETENALLASARVRNQWGGHGAGATARNTPVDLAELAVQGAATAILYLANRLP